MAVDWSRDNPHTILRAWYAKDLFGPWMPHALNPIKMDVRSSRPAGTPFVYEGKLYRPTQDCSETYGGMITICHVKRLSPTEFEEEEISKIKPYQDSPYPDGLHTISSIGNMTIIDGKRMVFRGKNIPMLISMAKRIILQIVNLFRKK